MAEPLNRYPAAIILAAGASSRMGGRPKALLRLEEGTFAAVIARTAREAGCGSIVFVLGPPHGEAIRDALPAGCAVAWNPDPARGMLTSVQAGIAALQQINAALQQIGAALQHIESALVWPVDQPRVASATLRALLDAPADRIGIPTHGGRGGHPVRIPRALWDDVLALAAERGLRGLMQDHAARILRLEVNDPGVVTDVDTPEDLARM